MGWGNQGGDPDMFGMWMEDLGEEQSSDVDDVSRSVSCLPGGNCLRGRLIHSVILFPPADDAEPIRGVDVAHCRFCLRVL